MTAPVLLCSAALLLQLLLSVALLTVTQATPISLDFVLTFANTTYPRLGELWTGTLTYDSQPLAIGPTQEGYPTGHPLLSITGTRTVWTPDVSGLYSYNSTANIVGLVPTNNCFLFNNGSIGLATGVQRVFCTAEQVLSPTAAYGTLCSFQYFNLTNYTQPDGFTVFPILQNAFNNLLYPPGSGVLDGLDSEGWMVELDSPQVGSVDCDANPAFPPGYNFAVNLYSWTGQPGLGGDISDFVGDVDLPDYGYEGVERGFQGSMQLTPAASSVLGDPSFVGLRGQQYQVHGLDGAVYSIISDDGLQINARFAFLSGGRCPSIPTPSQCWTHPGSYLSEFGIVTDSGDRLAIHSGSWQQGFSAVTLNGQQQAVGRAISGASVSGRYYTAFSLSFTVGNYELSLENSDGFINLLSVRVLHWAKLTERSHGLLGQTWRLTAARGRDVREVEGSVDDYTELNNDLLGNAFAYKA